jgi:nicotinamide phosphoribosyltransferase
MLELIKPVNFILACDSYKLGHWKEIPENIEYTYTVIVPRKPSKYANKICAMGHTYVACTLAAVRITEQMIDEAEIECVEQGYEFNRKDWEIITREFDGKLPLTMYGVEEGRIVDPQTPIMGFVNTDKRFGWLTAYIETWVQSAVWYMSTVASICRVLRTTYAKYMELSGADMSMLDYKMHNFGDRGAPGREAAVMSGISHAVFFSGSDCTQANGYIKIMYGTSKPYTSSVEATEHATMCLNSDASTKDDFGAAEMLVSRLEQRAKSKIGIPLISGVIDTYDDERFVDTYLGKHLKDRIIASGGKLVTRPDTGVPAVKSVEVLTWLNNNFGSTTNEKGYNVLHPAVSMIYGDGMDVTTFESVLKAATDAKFSIDNVTEGMGGGITNYGGRDDFSFSMKMVAAFDGKRWIKLLKAPKSDAGKTSLSGLVRCGEDVDGNLVVFDALDAGVHSAFMSNPGWRIYFHNGYREFRIPFDEVRNWARLN